MDVTQFEIDGGTFDMNVTILVTENIDYATKFVHSNLDTLVTQKDFDARGVTFTSEDGRNAIIWLPNANDISINTHELAHATINILTWAGIPLNDSTEEVFTYEMQHLSDQFYNQLPYKKHITYVK